MVAISGFSFTSFRRSTLVAVPGFRWLWCAHLISQFGDGLYLIALPWLVYLHTGSGIATTATLAAGAFSFLVVGPIAGVFVDRWDRRATLVASDLLRALTLLVFSVVLLFGFNLAAILAVAVLLPAFGRFFVPAQRASVPGLVPAEKLISANAQMQSAGNAAFIAGPAVAGVLIVSLGGVPLLLLDGLTFVGSAMLLRLVAFPPRAAVHRSSSSVRRELGEGLRISWNVPALRGSCLLAMFGTVCFAPVPAVVPLWVGRGGASAFGALMSAFFIGALLSSLIVARAGSRLSIRFLIVYSVLAMGFSIVAFGRFHGLLLGAVALASLGAFMTTYNVGVMTLLQRLSPAGATGRVFAVNETFSWSLRPFAVLLAGVIADRAGVHPLLVALGLGMIALGAIAFGGRWLRDDAPVSLVTAAEVA